MIRRGFRVRFLAVLLAAGSLSTTVLAEWHLDWSTIDGGGELEAEGGGWTLSGTIGQWDATADAALSGGEWQLSGGFWSAGAQADDRIFSDRFGG